MTNRSKILFVVEGKTETQLIDCLKKCFDFNAEVYAVNGNIYSLYLAVKTDPFLETVRVLAEMHNSESDKTILSQSFTDVFLVYDCDIHHTMNKTEAANISIEGIATRNMSIIHEMVARFDESTDPLKGKLLINYPMIESFRDADAFFDSSYKDAVVPLDKLKTYKNYVGKRQLARHHLKDYRKENFLDLILMNVCKLNKIFQDDFSFYPYDRFLEFNNQEKISHRESEMIKHDNLLSVLNTLLFFPIEYYGNNLYTKELQGLYLHHNP